MAGTVTTSLIHNFTREGLNNPIGGLVCEWNRNIFIGKIMKTIIAVAAVALLILFAGQAFASSVFVWEYTAADEANITGFKLYKDGKLLESVTIPKTARMVSVPAEVDTKVHYYKLTAYNDQQESDFSEVATVLPKPPAPTRFYRQLTTIPAGGK